MRARENGVNLSNQKWKLVGWDGLCYIGETIINPACLLIFIYTSYYFWVKIYFIVLSAMSEKKPYTKYLLIGTSFNHGRFLK